MVNALNNSNGNCANNLIKSYHCITLCCIVLYCIAFCKIAEKENERNCLSSWGLLIPPSSHMRIDTHTIIDNF